MMFFIVTALVCMILTIFYVFFDKRVKKRKMNMDRKNQLVREYYRQDMERIKNLTLMGIDNDGNSDYEFKQAIKKIILPDDIGIKKYD